MRRDGDLPTVLARGFAVVALLRPILFLRVAFGMVVFR
jgi:hypothetical protein